MTGCNATCGGEMGCRVPGDTALIESSTESGSKAASASHCSANGNEVDIRETC